MDCTSSKDSKNDLTISEIEILSEHCFGFHLAINYLEINLGSKLPLILSVRATFALVVPLIVALSSSMLFSIAPLIVSLVSGRVK